MPVAVGADGDSDVELGHVIWEVDMEEVGVDGVGDIGRDDKAVGVGLGDEVDETTAFGELLDDALHDDAEVVASSTLTEFAANLFIVKQTTQADGTELVGSIVNSNKEGLEGSPGAELVVNSAGKDELLAEAAESGWLSVKELKIPVEDAGVVLNSHLVAESLDEARWLRSSKAALWSIQLVGFGTLEANDWDHVSFLVEWAVCDSSEMGCESWDAGDWPVQLDQLLDNLSVLLHNHLSSNTEITIPPSPTNC